MRLSFLWGLLAFILFPSIEAQEMVRPHGYTEQEQKLLTDHNFKTAAAYNFKADFGFLGEVRKAPREQRRPYAEYDEAGYLIMSDQTAFGSGEVKFKMAQDLPEDMILVIFTQSRQQSRHEKILQDYSKYVEPHRIRVIETPLTGNSLWARDSVPVPVWTETQRGAHFTLADAKYYHSFEPDQIFANYFYADLTRHDFFFEGGNFTANNEGHCIVVNNKLVQQIPASIFTSHYGCKKLLRLPHVKGIGHIDESVKFIDDQTVLTDEVSYLSSLRAQGYKILQLPRPKGKMETYVNSLIVNGTAFVPVFNQPQDAEALKVYQSLGYKVVPVNSSELSNKGLGSLHCITMSYPKVPFNELLKAVKGVAP